MKAKFIKESLYNAEINLEPHSYEIKKLLIGTEEYWSHKIIKDVTVWNMESGDVCSPLLIEFEDGSEKMYYGFDVQSILRNVEFDIEYYRTKFIDEDAMGGVSAPSATLYNVPGVGNATPAATTDMSTTGSGDSWGNGDMYDQNGKIKKKKEKKKEKKKVEENNLNPYDQIGAMMAGKMGVKQPFKKVDSRTNRVKQEFFEEAPEPNFSLPTLDQYAKAAQHVPVHPLETREGKIMDEAEEPREHESLKDTKAKNLLKDLGIPFIYKPGPSGKHRVYIKRNINDVRKQILEIGWEEVGKNEDNTIKKFHKDEQELAIFADGKELPRVTLKPIAPVADDVIESILSKKVVSNSLEPYI
jgi:hypothetical protein